MKRINKKGFTLIELLAIIVILAVIAVITVPLILGIIDNAKEKAVIDSAYGYKDSINKYYLSSLLKNSESDNLDGLYNIDGNGNLEKSATETYDIAISGQHPTDGYVVIQDKQTSGCLVYGDYAVIINNEEVTNTKKSDCRFATQNDAYIIGELTVGDLVCINNTEECFYVISSENGITSMLARYNLNVGNNTQSEEFGKLGLQNSKAIGVNADNSTKDANNKYPATVFFSLTNYWCDNNYQLLSDYGTSYPVNVYKQNEEGLIISNYINSYKEQLADKGSIIKNIRLMTYDEVVSSNIIGCNASSYTCTNVSNEKRFIYNTSFYLGTAENAMALWIIDSNGYLSYASGVKSLNSNNDSNFGVRPVIEIPTSAIKLKSE